MALEIIKQMSKRRSTKSKLMSMTAKLRYKGTTPEERQQATAAATKAAALASRKHPRKTAKRLSANAKAITPAAAKARAKKAWATRRAKAAAQ